MLAHILNSINDFFWDIPFLTFIVGIGLYFFIKSRLFPVVHFGHILRHTVFSSKKEQTTKEKGTVSPFEAVCIYWRQCRRWLYRRCCHCSGYWWTWSCVLDVGLGLLWYDD